MSTRLYPKYVLGNPQLRIFLPDFWMILVKNRSEHMAKNKVTFKVHPRMTEYDVRNYLEKIYKIPVKEIRTAIHSGEYPLGPTGTHLIHEPDFKMCYITLPRDWKFTHPDTDLFTRDGKSSDDDDLKNYEKQLDEAKKKVVNDNPDRQGVPTWFSF